LHKILIKKHSFSFRLKLLSNSIDAVYNNDVLFMLLDITDARFARAI